MIISTDWKCSTQLANSASEILRGLDALMVKYAVIFSGQMYFKVTDIVKESIHPSLGLFCVLLTSVGWGPHAAMNEVMTMEMNKKNKDGVF